MKEGFLANLRINKVTTINKKLHNTNTILFSKYINMTSQTKISEGYSTVLPAEIRKKLNLSPGDILQWDIENNSIIIVPRKKVTLSDICGCIGSGGDAVKDKRNAQSWEL